MMDHLVGPILQTALDIKEGKGFGFLTNPLIVVAALNGNKLESSEIRPSSHPIFDTQLLWQSEKKYLKRLRTGNTALKIECFVVINENKRDRLGYILLNLKEAQIIPRNSGIAVLETWHRLLGLRSEAKNHNPEVLISFKIEEGNDSDEICNDKESGQGKSEFPHRAKTPYNEFDSNGSADPEPDPGVLQIGPPELCKDFYELTVCILEIHNLYSMITPSEVGLPITIQYSLMGRTFATGNLLGALDGFINFHSSFEMKSTAKFLSAYFQEFPSLVINIMCDGKIMGSATLELQEFSKLEETKISSLKSKIPIKTWNQSGSKFSDTHAPSLQVAVNLLLKQSPNIYVSDNRVKPNLVTPKMIGLRKQVIQPLNWSNLEVPSAKRTSEEDLPQVLKDKPKIVPPKDVMNAETQADPKESTTFETVGTCTSSPSQNLDVTDLLPRQYVREAAIKTCEELEDWKDQQEEIFKFELKRKAERHLKKLTYEWNKRKRELENSLQERIEACQSIFRRLEDACDEIKKQSDIISKAQKELQDSKQDLNDKYSSKFEELRRASLMYKKDVNKTINSLLKENVRLKTKLDHKDMELAELIRGFNRRSGPCRWCSTKINDNKA